MSSNQANKHAERAMSGRRPSKKDSDTSRTNVALRANFMKNGALFHPNPIAKANASENIVDELNSE